jgi:hypothetical protein
MEQRADGDEVLEQMGMGACRRWEQKQKRLCENLEPVAAVYIDLMIALS